MSTSRVHAVDEILKKVKSLPSISKSIAEIIRTIDDDTTTSEMLSAKIESDLGLLTGVLKLVNSSRYAVRGGVTSTQQAVMVLGFNSIRNLACMEGISDYFRKNSNKGFDFEKFMRHSVGVACCAKRLARQVKLNPEIAFVSGLLHDVGQLAMAITLPHEYRLVEEYQKFHDCHLAVAEQAVLETDHAQIGAYLVNLWNFPPEIGEAIECHHKMFDTESDSRMADLIHVSEVLSHALDLGMTSQVPPLCDSALLRLDLSLHQMRPLFDEIEDEYNDLAQMLGV